MKPDLWSANITIDVCTGSPISVNELCVGVGLLDSSLPIAIVVSVLRVLFSVSGLCLINIVFKQGAYLSSKYYYYYIIIKYY